MILKRIILFTIFSLFICNVSLAQRTSSFEGKHFIIGFMENEICNDPIANYLQIFITSTANAQISVRIQNQATEYYFIDKDSILRINVPLALENRTSEVVSNKTIEIDSDVPISLYTFNTQRWTSESYAAIPVAYWGNEYVVMSYPNDQYRIMNELTPEDSLYMLEPRSSEFMVIAAYDNTTISFKPKTITEQGKQTYNTYSVNLNKNECYLVKSFHYNRGMGDLTGTIVSGNKPFGILSGHVRTAITYDVDYPFDSKNHLIEMLIPTTAWGRHFVSVPYGVNQTGDLFRVTAIQANTIVDLKTKSDQFTYILDKPGDFVEIPKLNEVCHWTANRPIQIGQFMRHTGLLDDYKEYDPCFAMVQPIEQYVSRILFQTPGNSQTNPLQFSRHLVTIIAEDKALNTLKIDTTLIKNFTLIENNNIQGTNLYWIRIEIYPGKHELTCDSGSFSGMLYGTGNADAYSMVLGASLTNPFIRDTISPSFSYSDECGWLTGFVFDGSDSAATGIDYIKIISDSSYNYSFTTGKLTDTSTFIRFEAKPIDYTKDAKLVIDYRDRNGNGGRFRYFYKGIDLKLPNEISFPDINPNDSACWSFIIINNNDTTIELEYLKILSSKISIKTSKPLPIRLAKGELVQVIVCFIPKGDMSSLYDSILVSFECGKIKTIPIYGKVLSYSLKTKGTDFGYIYVGDTSCSDIVIINDGNVPIIIDSISISPPNSDYEFFTKDLFPYTIEPGDSLVIPVCFMPKKIGSAIIEVWFNNNFRLPAKAIVTGTGILPDVNSIVIDWGKRRIGSINDTLFPLKNDGNGGCTVKFNSFLVECGGFESKNIENINHYLNAFSSINIATSFQPDTVGKYFKQALCSIDVIDSNFTISLVGEGTLPEIIAHHIIFDTTVVYTYRDSTCLLIESTGNERLSVNLESISGDFSSFVINNGDLSIFDNLILDPDSSLIIPIRFNPQKLGWNEVVLYIKHDAIPGLNNYEIAEIHIIGFAVTILIEDNLKTKPIYACKQDFFEYSLHNRSNVSVELQELNLTEKNVQAYWLDYPNLPLVLKPDTTVTYRINILAKKNESGSIKINAQLQDSVLLEEEYIINPIVSAIIIDDIEDFKVTPGDTFSLNISGRFPKEISIKTDFSLNLKLKQSAFQCLSSKSTLTIFNYDNIQKYDVEIVQTYDSIQIILPENIEIIDPNASWQINLQFLALLNNLKEHKIEIYAASNICYDFGEKTFQAELAAVCVNTMRTIKLIGEPPEIRISPNPATDFLKIEVRLFDENELDFEIFDENGKKLTFFSKLVLKKGLYCLIFEITDLTNGIYFLKIRLKEEIKNYIIIVSK